MKWVLAVVLAVSALGVAPAAVADECVDGLCVGTTGSISLPQPPPSEPTPAPTPPPDPPRVHGPFPAMRGTDHRPCVSRREFNGIKEAPRAEVEKRWEVQGLGLLSNVAAYGPAVLYPRCGYLRSEAFYGADYRHGVLYGVVQWRNETVAPHGLI